MSQKLNQDEITKVTNIKNKVQEIIFSLGSIKLQQEHLKSSEQIILSEYDKLQKEEQILLEQLQKKYGQGVIDTQTWEILPKSNNKGEN